MSEVEKPVEEAIEAQEAAPQMSESEARARASGWVPEAEYTGTAKWRDHEDFNDRGELFAKIADTKRQAQAEIRRTQQAMQAHLATVRKAEYQRAIQEVRNELREAKREGDVDAEFAAQDKMAALDAQHRAEQAQLTQVVNIPAEPPAEFLDWKEKNSWYGPQNQAMTDFADNEGNRLMASGRGLTPAQILKEVEARVRSEFPQKFVNPNRERPGAVESSSRGSPKGESYQMTALETKIMNDLVKAKVLTKEQYIADLRAKAGR